MAERAHNVRMKWRPRRSGAGLAELSAERTALETQLKKLLRPAVAAPSGPTVWSGATVASPAAEKVALFRALFGGRADVFPLRWENAKAERAGYAPACANEWVTGVCGKPRVKCGNCPNQAFVPVSNDVIESHLRGVDQARPRSGVRDFVAGVYPLLPDETCRFLAADFDRESWARDALAYIEPCRARAVPAALERSRSGEGGHVWIFFSRPVPAREARQLGTMLMTETMDRRPEVVEQDDGQSLSVPAI